MESNSNDNYVLVLEDRTEVTNEKEAGKLSVVSGIDDKGNLKTTEAVAANQAAFLKFSNKDGLLKNFMTNFLKQFNNPTHFGLYKVLADNVEQGVDNLRTMLQSREKPENKQQLAEIGVPFEDYLPQQKNATAIDESKVDWKQLDNLVLPLFKRIEAYSSLTDGSVHQPTQPTQMPVYGCKGIALLLQIETIIIKEIYRKSR